MSVAALVTHETAQPYSETALKAAMLAYMAEFGFTNLRVTYARLEGEISRTHRIELAAEGWIS